MIILILTTVLTVHSSQSLLVTGIYELFDPYENSRIALNNVFSYVENYLSIYIYIYIYIYI